MNVATIDMDPTVARERLTAYQKSLRRRSDEEYEAAVAGYQALAEGTPLIQLGEAIRSGGFDEQMRPRLAVGRADRRQVCFRWREDQWATFDTTAGFNQSVTSRSLLIQRVDMGRPHGVQSNYGGAKWITAYALVPMVPPEALAAAGGTSRLREHLILWEVEEWADRPIQAVPDRDPMLLRPIYGDLYAVVAQWDLTPLERAVMTGRRDG